MALRLAPWPSPAESGAGRWDERHRPVIGAHYTQPVARGATAFVSPRSRNGPDLLTRGRNHLTRSASADRGPIQRRRPRRCLGCRNRPALIGSTRMVRIQRIRALAFLPWTGRGCVAAAGRGWRWRPRRRRTPRPIRRPTGVATTKVCATASPLDLLPRPEPQRTEPVDLSDGRAARRALRGGSVRRYGDVFRAEVGAALSTAQAPCDDGHRAVPHRRARRPRRAV